MDADGPMDMRVGACGCVGGCVPEDDHLPGLDGRMDRGSAGSKKQVSRVRSCLLCTRPAPSPGNPLLSPARPPALSWLTLSLSPARPAPSFCSLSHSYRLRPAPICCRTTSFGTWRRGALVTAPLSCWSHTASPPASSCSAGFTGPWSRWVGGGAGMGWGSSAVGDSSQNQGAMQCCWLYPRQHPTTTAAYP